MYNTGCIMALLKSVKVLKANIESARDTIDQRVYENSIKELDSMKRFMEDMAGLGPGVFGKKT